jgi:hypothetical protein
LIEIERADRQPEAESVVRKLCPGKAGKSRRLHSAAWLRQRWADGRAGKAVVVIQSID